MKRIFDIFKEKEPIITEVRPGEKVEDVYDFLTDSSFMRNYWNHLSREKKDELIRICENFQKEREYITEAELLTIAIIGGYFKCNKSKNAISRRSKIINYLVDKKEVYDKIKLRNTKIDTLGILLDEIND